MACLCFCIYTETGTKATLEFINDFTNYSIKYDHVSGTFGHHLSFDALELKSKDFKLQAQSLSVSWQWLLLFQSEINVSQLNAQNIALILHHSETTTPNINSLDDLQNFVNSKLFFHMTINEGEIQKAKISTPTFTHDIEHIVLKTFQSNHLLDLKYLSYEGSLGFIHAQQDEKLQVKWDLTLSAPTVFSQWIEGKVKTKGDAIFYEHDLKNEKNKIDAEFFVEKLNIKEKELLNSQINIQGSLQAHNIAIKSILGDPIEIITTATWHQSTWTGNIEKILFSHKTLNKLPSTYGTLKISKKSNWKVQLNMNVFGESLNSKLTIKKDAPFAMSGKIQSQIQNLKSLNHFFPFLSGTTDGSIDIDIDLKGTVFSPEFVTKAKVSGIHFSMPQYGTKTILDKIEITQNKKNEMLIDGYGHINNKKFTIDGLAHVKNYQPYLSVNIKGENLVLSQTPEYFIVASPNLNFTLENNVPKLSGHIHIPQADIKQLNHSKKASHSGDIVIINHEKSHEKKDKAVSSTIPLSTQIEISLGNNLKYKGKGLNCQFKGHLKLTQKPNQIPRLKGEINLINGKYRFQGKSFNLTHGKLIFTGSTMSNPLIDIEAKQTVMALPRKKSAALITQMDMGVRLKGKLNDPKISFFSNPSMSEADIISYLILGRPQSEASQGQAELLFQAVSQLSSMFGNENNDISHNLAERLKLDYVAFSKGSNNQNTSLEDTVLMLGKQLSDRLYLNYSLGFLDSTNSIGMQYVLGRNLSVEAQTGTTGSSADVIISLDH
ncbi:translocation/assembly module TamB [Candidatus Berkiella cookevillensis]|uniref:Translocation and assembly module TamB n=1 Tax=Candidatus Berkiella cookevillensis TaxID=437022 RepID=A0A0Q9YQV9_9GAMM|nr:translocation/assembly module TamB domain-containing protein [Candidatus Berkiella cookevillensis]MCS5708866.1 translocation/assembly module TamB [Candidatus Berkiella cookevillensis]